MRIIKLFLLFTFALWADFKLDIPNDINTSLLKNIVENGWDESNVTLNNFIIKNIERVMPEIREKIKKPILKVKPTEDEPFPISKIILVKDDYLLIVAYIKYLENEGKFNEAKNLYLEMLKGFNNIQDLTMLNVIFRMVEEGIITDGLLHAVEKNYYSKTMKIELKNSIEKLVLLDVNQYFIAIEKEKDFILEASKLSFFRTEKQDTLEYKKLITEVYKNLEDNINLYFSKMMIAIKILMKEKKSKALDKFSKYMSQEKEDHMSFKNKVMFGIVGFIVKIKNMIGIGNESYGFMSKFMGKTLALVAMPKINSTYLEYAELIEKNKKLLKQLEN